MYMKMAALLLASAMCFVISSASIAGDVLLDVHGLSKHINTDTEYNEINFGLGLSLTSGHFGVSLGRYHNSRGRMSDYVLMTVQTYELVSLYNTRLAVDFGAVSGYVKHALPVVVPSIKMRAHDRVVISLRYLPPLKDMMPAVASLSISIKLN